MRSSYSYTLTPVEYAAALMRRSSRYLTPRYRGALAGIYAGYFGAIGLLIVLAVDRRSIAAAPVFWAAVAIMVLSYGPGLVQRYALRRALAESRLLTVSARTLTVEESGLHWRSDRSDIF